jgi:chromosome partitioning protein
MVETIYNVGRIEARLEQLSHGGVTMVIVDTAGGISAVTAAAIKCADLCLIPSRPTITDIEASAATLKAVRAWQKPFAFVMNQTPVRGRRIDDAASALGGEDARAMGDVLARPFISMRNDHQDAMASGLGVSEYAPGGKSAEEIAQLWRWVEARLNGGALNHEPRAKAAVPARLPAVETQEVETARPTTPGEGLTPWDACL